MIVDTVDQWGILSETYLQPACIVSARAGQEFAVYDPKDRGRLQMHPTSTHTVTEITMTTGDTFFVPDEGALPEMIELLINGPAEESAKDSPSS